MTKCRLNLMTGSSIMNSNVVVPKKDQPYFYGWSFPYRVGNLLGMTNEFDEVNEVTIVRVALMLSFQVTLEDIRDQLLREGLSEYNVFLAAQAGKVYNVIQDKVY